MVMESEHLIQLVKLRPALWNQQDKAHHNRYILEKMWNEVASEIKQPRKAVRDKWKNLRDMYRKEFHKTRKASGKDTSFQESESYWPHFNSLSFMKDQFTIRAVDGNFQGLIDNQSTNEFTDEDSLIDDSNDTNFLSVDNIEKDSKPFRTSTTELPEAQWGSSSGKRSFKHLVADDILDTDKKKLKIPENESLISNDKVRNDDKVRDDDEDFLFSMLPFMKELPLAEKLLCRIRMQEVLFSLLFKKGPIESKTYRAKPPPPYRDPFPSIGNASSSSLPASLTPRSNENSD